MTGPFPSDLDKWTHLRHDDDQVPLEYKNTVGGAAYDREQISGYKIGRDILNPMGDQPTWFNMEGAASRTQGVRKRERHLAAWAQAMPGAVMLGGDHVGALATASRLDNMQLARELVTDQATRNQDEADLSGPRGVVKQVENKVYPLWPETSYERRLPGGLPGILVAGTYPDTAVKTFLPSAGPIIVDHRSALPDDFSTMVYDINGTTLSDLYVARTSTAWRVGREYPALLGPEPVLAWVCGESPRGAGFGNAWFGGISGGGVTPISNPTTGPGSPEPDYDALPTNAPVNEKFIATGPGAYSLMSWEQDGPLHPGAGAQDKHYHGNDNDGAPYTSGHIGTRAFYYMDKVRDAPIQFELPYHPPTAEGIYPYQGHLRYDPSYIHPWKGHLVEGMWRIHVRLNFAPPEREEPPEEPGPPPEDTPPTEPRNPITGPGAGTGGPGGQGGAGGGGAGGSGGGQGPNGEDLYNWAKSWKSYQNGQPSGDPNPAGGSTHGKQGGHGGQNSGKKNKPRFKKKSGGKDKEAQRREERKREHERERQKREREREERREEKRRKRAERDAKRNAKREERRRKKQKFKEGRAERRAHALRADSEYRRRHGPSAKRGIDEGDPRGVINPGTGGKPAPRSPVTGPSDDGLPPPRGASVPSPDGGLPRGNWSINSYASAPDKFRAMETFGAGGAPVAVGAFATSRRDGFEGLPTALPIPLFISDYRGVRDQARADQYDTATLRPSDVRLRTGATHAGIATPGEVSLPSLMFHGVPMRETTFSWDRFNPQRDNSAAGFVGAPITAHLQGFGKEGATGWQYDSRPAFKGGNSLWKSGDAEGGLAFLPPQVQLDDVNPWATTGVTTTSMLFHPAAQLVFGEWDADSKAIVSAYKIIDQGPSGGSLALIPVDSSGVIDYTKNLTLGEYTIPLADGTANQVLQTDGSGTVSWATASGGSGDISSASNLTTGRLVRATGNKQIDSPYAIDLNNTTTDSANDTIQILVGPALYLNLSGSGAPFTLDNGGTEITVDEDLVVNGKLTVTGLIDPTGLELTSVSANPGGTTKATLWIDDGTTWDADSFILGTSATPVVVPGLFNVGGTGSEQNSVTYKGSSQSVMAMFSDHADNYNALVNLHKHSTGSAFTDGPLMVFSRSHSTGSSHGAVQADDYLGGMFFIGHDSTDYNPAAAMYALADQTFNDGGTPTSSGRFEFHTTPANTQALALAFTIGADKALTGESSMYLKEQAAALGDTAGYGQLWVKNDTPNKLYFTDDAGTDHQLGAGLSVADLAFEARLSPSSSLAVPVGDIGSFGTIYLHPYKGNRIALYNTTDSVWEYHELSSAINVKMSGHTANYPADVFVYDNSGTLTLQLVDWTNSNTRATALTTQDGVYVKSGAANYRYVGTVLPATASTALWYLRGGNYYSRNATQGLWNYYNRIGFSFFIKNNATSHTYNGVWRYYDNSSYNAVVTVIGVDEDFVNAWGHAYAGTSTTTAVTGIGHNSGVGIDAKCFTGSVYAGYSCLRAHLEKQPGIGHGYFTFLERSPNNATFYDLYGTDEGLAGMTVKVKA